jgi:hypothetical protein
VAEARYVTRVHGEERTVRLVVRRTRLTGRAQRTLWPDWRHHAFVTGLEVPTIEVDRFHREHATGRVGHPRREGKSGLDHCSSASSSPTPPLAHNLTRWTVVLGYVHPPSELTVMRTVRTRLFALPGGS